MKCYEIYEEAGVGSKIVAKTAPSRTPWYSMPWIERRGSRDDPNLLAQGALFHLNLAAGT